MGNVPVKDMKKGVSYCELCGFNSPNRKKVVAHVKDVHKVKGKVK